MSAPVKVPFVSPGYQSRSLQANAQRRVNCYIELDRTSERAPAALYRRPGLRRKLTFATNGARGAIDFNGYAFWVYGNTIYRLSADMTTNIVGTIASSAGPVSIAASSVEILIVDGVGGWIINTSGTLSKITDEGFPNGVTSAAYQDGYFIVCGDGSGKFYLSDILAGGSWNTLDQATAETNRDALLVAMNYNQQLFLGGEKTCEFWQDTGAESFPFQRIGNGTMQMGIMAPFSAQQADNSIFWLGGNDEGDGIAWRLNGWSPVRISESAIERVWQGYPSRSDAFAWTMQLQGHLFYVLNFPSGDATWVYDIATQFWYEWLAADDNEEHRFRGAVHLFWNGTHYLGDRDDGRLYAVDLDYNLDDQQRMKVITAAPGMSESQVSVKYTRLLADMETGTETEAPKVVVRYSDTAGRSWSNERSQDLGALGDFGWRVEWYRLGAGRNRVFELSCSDDSKFVLLGAYVEAETGKH